MRGWSWLVLLLVAPIAALADEPAPVPVDEGRWNVGAGIQTTTIVSSTALLGTGVIATAPLPPVVVEVERRFFTHSWLTLGAIGGGSSSNSNGGTPADTSSASTETVSQTSGSFGLSLGLREVLSGDLPVEISVFGSAVFSYSVSSVATNDTTTATSSPLLTSVDTTLNGSTATTYGVSLTAGLTFDRKLIEHLHLRLALTLLDATFDSSTDVSTNSMTYSVGSMTTNTPSPTLTTHGTSFTANVVIQPALTLRYVF